MSAQPHLIPHFSPRQRVAADCTLVADRTQAVRAGRFFGTLSPALRSEILRRGYLRNFRDGEPIAFRGDSQLEWMACAMGAVRVSSTTASGRQITFEYIGPGDWFGESAMFDEAARLHDAHAHGDTTLLCVSRTDVQALLASQPDFCTALLRLQSQRIRSLFCRVEDIKTLPLRSQLAKQLLSLGAQYGVPAAGSDGAVCIDLRLAQEDLAQLLGASRQRVNKELKAMERDQHIRIQPRVIVLRDPRALERTSEIGR